MERFCQKNLRSWQRNIGYVPQNIYLSDDTIANIAFGVESKINQIDIERASKIANLHDFIINELPDKYNTTIGERHKTIWWSKTAYWYCKSGLPKSKDFNFDEGTSALDNETEKVMELLINLVKK